MTKTYTIDVSDLDLAVLSWKYVNPNQHIDDVVTNRVNIAIKELAEQEIQRRFNDPNWSEPIPADYEEILKGMVIKSARQIQAESSEYAQEMVRNPDMANDNPVPSSFYPLSSGAAAP
jgi:hypothetical protein